VFDELVGRSKPPTRLFLLLLTVDPVAQVTDADDRYPGLYFWPAGQR
jgi:hypothetical protein